MKFTYYLSKSAVNHYKQAINIPNTTFESSYSNFIENNSTLITRFTT